MAPDDPTSGVLQHRIHLRCLAQLLLSLPQRCTDASLAQWCGSVVERAATQVRVNELVEAICARLDAYWPDHQVSPLSATVEADGAGEVDLLFLVPRQDPIRAVRLVRDLLHYDHGCAGLYQDALPLYWGFPGEHELTTLTMDVVTLKLRGYVTVTSDPALFEQLATAAESTIAALEDGNISGDGQAPGPAVQLAHFLRRWRRYATGLDGSLVAVSVLDAIAAHVVAQQAPSTPLRLLVQCALELMECTSAPLLIGPIGGRHSDVEWRSVATIASATKRYLFP